ncbi:MAG: SulP family inorganic anion transporter [Flavobacteriales bacterium]|nr:SulP family inorganic anion transporter [Flavobacteriales bacterium]
MTPKQTGGFFSNLKSDLPAAVVVFLVALPLCLGIALASDAPLFAGIIAGIVGGTVVALISGSPLGVSGPAAGLALIVANSIKDLGGNFEAFLVAVVLAGIIQIILGVIKAGVIGYYFPNAVIKGMLAGIGVIIALKQIPHACGWDKDPQGDFEFLQVDGRTTFSEIIAGFEHIKPGAILITLVSLAILILWESKWMKNLSFTKVVKGPLVVVILGILATLWYQSSGIFVMNPEQLVSIEVADSFSGFIGNFTTPDWSFLADKQIYITALVIAVVASLETLLCVEATDKLDPQKRITPTNRELIAQGTGNMLSGLIGGLPITQVIVRSSANIQSGGQSKASAFFHGIMLLLAVAFIPQWINLIPYASLAAILLVVGYKLAKPSLWKEMYNKGMMQLIPFVVTVVGIVLTDLLIGIALGMVVAIAQILWNNYRTPYHFDPDKVEKGKTITINLSEDVSFLNKAGIIHTLELLPDDSTVVFDATKTKTIHQDILDILQNFEIDAKNRGISLTRVGFDKFGTENTLKQFKEVVDS